MKTVTLEQFLTHKEIARARQLYASTGAGPGMYAKRVCEELIRPNLARINVSLGQDNDPLYLAFAVEYAMRMSRVAR